MILKIWTNFCPVFEWLPVYHIWILDTVWKPDTKIYNIPIPVQKNYSGDLNTGIVWYLNCWKLSDDQIVESCKIIKYPGIQLSVKHPVLEWWSKNQNSKSQVNNRIKATWCHYIKKCIVNHLSMKIVITVTVVHIFYGCLQSWYLIMGHVWPLWIPD